MQCDASSEFIAQVRAGMAKRTKAYFLAKSRCPIVSEEGHSF